MKYPEPDASAPDRTEVDTIRLVMVYDNFEAGIRGQRLIDRLTKNLGGDCRLDCGIWRSDLLNDHSCRNHAIRDTTVADMVVVAMDGENGRTDSINDWVSGWLPDKGVPSALVALCSDRPAGKRVRGSESDGAWASHACPPVLAGLMKAAGQAGMDVFNGI